MPLHRVVIWCLVVSASGLAGCKTTEVPGSSVYEVLPGTWGLRQSKRYGCDVNPHVIRFSEDRKEITLTYARPAGDDDDEPAIIRLQVLSDSPRLRVFRHGERRRIPSTNELVIWDLVMVSADEHCWHRPDRNTGSCTRRVVRCPADPPAAPAESGDVPVAPESEEARRIQTMVERAAALIESRGKTAFAEFRRPDSEWWSGQTYLFAYDQDLNVLLNPAFPKREGTNPRGEKDANGKAMHDEFLKVVRERGAGWVDYLFPRPGESRPSQKWSYVKSVKIDGVPGIVGAGFYPEPDPPE